MRTRTRLSRLEAAWGLQGGPYRDPIERSQARIEAGLASPEDFARVMGPEGVRAWQAVLAIGAMIYAESVVKPPTVRPLEVAAAIAATPDHGPVPESLLRKSVHWSTSPMPAASSSKPSGVFYDMWVHEQVLLAALGQPDGMPLRQALSRGEYLDPCPIVNGSGLAHLVPWVGDSSHPGDAELTIEIIELDDDEESDEQALACTSQRAVARPPQ